MVFFLFLTGLACEFRRLGAFLAHLVAIFGLSWPILAPILTHLAPLLVHLAPILAHLGSELPKIEKIMKKQQLSFFFGTGLACEFLRLGAFLAHLGAIFGLSWPILAPILAHRAPLLVHLASILAHLGSELPKIEKY